MKQMNKKYLFNNLNEETLKTKIVFFKNNYSENLRNEVAKNKMLLSYDDRTDAFYLFSNFTTQYVMTFKELKQDLELTIFKANKDTDGSADLYIAELEDFITKDVSSGIQVSS